MGVYVSKKSHKSILVADYDSRYVLLICKRPNSPTFLQAALRASILKRN